MLVVENKLNNNPEIKRIKNAFQKPQRINMIRITKFIRIFQHTSKYYVKTGSSGKNLKRKYEQKNKKRQDGLIEHTYYPLYGRKRKMAHVVGKIHANIWN